MKVVIGFSALSLMLTACTQTFTGTEGDATVAPVSGVPMTAADSAYRLMARDPAFAELFKSAHKVVEPLYAYASTLPESQRSRFLDSKFALIADPSYLGSILSDTSAVKDLFKSVSYLDLETSLQSMQSAKYTLAQNVNESVIKNGTLTPKHTKESLALVPEVSMLFAEGGSDPTFPGSDPLEANNKCRDACDDSYSGCVVDLVIEFAMETGSASVMTSPLGGLIVGSYGVYRLIRNSQACDRNLTSCLANCK